MADEHFFADGDFASGLGAAPFFGPGPYAPPGPLDAAAMAPFGAMLPWAAELALPADSAATAATAHFDSALSSLVSSPAHGGGDDVAIGDLIGRLGSICNTAASASNSCYSTPLSSPPRPGATAPPLEAGRLSRVASSKSLGAAAAAAPASENAGAVTPAKGAARKRKGKASSSATTAAAANGSPKRPKVAGDDKCNDEDATAGEEEKKPEPVKDYIHVRARRGQATDSHSLAERVRREKISERMKLLQSLVPGCNKITGKALMLDEIINYVQSLQRQVEFLSMKLATMNPELDVGAQYLPSDKDMMHHHEAAAAMLGSYPHDLPYGGGPFAGGGGMLPAAFHPGAGGGFGWAQDLQSVVHRETTAAPGHEHGHLQQQQELTPPPAHPHHHHGFHDGAGGQQAAAAAATVSHHMKMEP